MSFDQLLDRMAALEQRGRFKAARRLLERNIDVVPRSMERTQRARYFELTEGLGMHPGARESLLEALWGLLSALMRLMLGAGRHQAVEPPRGLRVTLREPQHQPPE
jgi:hypothetical protein